MGTTWGPSESYGDDVVMMGMMQGQCGDDRDDVGTTGTTCGDHGDNMWRPRRPQTMGTTWGPSEGYGYGDNVGMTGTTGTTWGQCGDNRDHKITKTAITFE